MDELLSHASKLAETLAQPINAPIQGRIAYVVSHGQSYASNGYAIRTQGIAHALNQHGFETLCFVRPGRPWELNAESNVAPETTIEGVRYIHTRWKNDASPKSGKPLLEESINKYIELFRVYRPGAVLAASNHAVGLPAWVAAKRLGLPFYNEVRGFWELSRAAREPEYENSAAFHKEAERDSFVAQQAEKVFTLNQPMKEELVKRGVKAENIAIVPNGVTALPNIKPAKPALKKRLGIEEGDKVVGYIGSFSAYEGLEVLLEACAQLTAQGEKIKLLLVGDEQPITKVVGGNAIAKERKSTAWLIQIGRVPHEEVGDYYALLDAVVIPRKPLAVCNIVPPIKAAEALSYGKRLVVSDIAPLTEYAKENKGVVSFKADNASSLAESLQGALKLPAPKSSTELLFSAHTEPMVRALKGEEGQQGGESEPVAKPTEAIKPQAQSKTLSKAATATPVMKPTVESKAKAVEKKGIKHRPKSFVESEVVDYSYGDAVYADGHEVSSRFYDLSQTCLIWTVEVEGCQEIDVFFNLKLANAAPSFVALKEVVAKIEFYDVSSNVLNPSKRIPKSPSVGSYIYLKFSGGAFTKLSLPVPPGAHKLSISAIKWGAGKKVYISSVSHCTRYKKGVSVVIPSYKGEDTIRECLDSLAAQTLAKKDFEIIVILNGEPDNTSNIVDHFKQENPEISLLLTRNDVAGAGAARNHGISLASREYVTFVDDDDFVSVGFLQGLVAHSGQNEIVVSNIEDFNESGFFESSINQQVKRSAGNDRVGYGEITSAITLNACKLVPARFVKSVKYNSFLKSGEDVDYWSRLVCLFNPEFRCVDESSNAIYYRRVRENSVSRQKESFEFNVKQRLEVVVELEGISPSEEMRGFVASKVNAQLGFVNRYLEKNPEAWVEFKHLADQLGLSSRAFQYVNEKQSKTLVISYCFPPYIDTAGIVCAKRIIESNKPVDVVSNTMSGVRERDDSLWELVKPYVGRFQEVQAYPSFSSWKAIEDFCSRALMAVEKNIQNYNEIYSRSMWPGSHFAAALLKMKHAGLKWVAEFSDPLRVDVHGKERHVDMNKAWLVGNGFTRKIEESGFIVDDSSHLFYWCEMLPYIFADEFIFTNESQKVYMLGMLSDGELKKRVERRALVSQHPTLPNKFYNLSGYEYPLDDSKANIGYFGSFYATRGIDDVLTALRILPEEVKEKIRVHVFTPKPEAVIIDKGLGSNVVVNKVLPYLDFLSVSRSFDALLVNDAETKGLKWINPYLPSKLSDYKGSGASVWALFEEGSELSRFGSSQGVLYKSSIGDIEQAVKVFFGLVSDLRLNDPTPIVSGSL